MGMDITGRNPKNETGEYFRANLWSWRPIQMLIAHVNDKYNLEFDLEGYGENSGAGLDNQVDSDQLANTLYHVIESDKDLKEDDDILYVNLGMWVNDNGGFTVPEHIQEELNEQYPIGTKFHTSIVASNGELVNPAWGTSKKHIMNFIDFLYSCGGFQIF